MFRNKIKLLSIILLTVKPVNLIKFYLSVTRTKDTKFTKGMKLKHRNLFFKT